MQSGNTASFGARLYPSRVRDMVTTSVVTSAGYELALGGSQTCNIWLPKEVNEEEFSGSSEQLLLCL